MNNEPITAQEGRGIRPSVWMFLVVGVIAIGVIGFFARRSDKSAATAEGAPGVAAEGATAPNGVDRVPSAQEAQAEVQAVFKKYSQALLDRDGEQAFSLIDSHTALAYEEMLRDALSLPAKDLDRLDYVHKITVLRLRTEFRKPQLQALTGRDVFVVAVTNGWMSKSTIQSVPAFQKVTVKGRYAQAYFPVDPKRPAFFFIYEDSQWKISVWKTFEMANAAMRLMKQESKLSEKEFLLTMLRKLSRFNVNSNVFEGPID